MSQQLPDIPRLPTSGADAIPSLSDLDAPVIPTLSPPLRRPLTGARQASPILQPPSGRQLTESQARQILERVHNRQMSWEEAATALKDFPDGLRDKLFREYQTRPDATMHLDEVKALTDGGKRKKGSLVGNLIEDVATSVKGLPAGIYKTGKAGLQDIAASGGNPLQVASNLVQDKSAVRNDILEPIAQQYADTYGPALKGDFGETAHRIGEHPLGPILDVLAVASAGIGTAGRAAAASNAMKVTKITQESADKLRMGVTAEKPAGQFIIARGKGDSTLWSVRDTKGRIVAGGMPSKDAAVAHAQSLVTGGVLAPVLETEWRHFSNPKFVEAQGRLEDLQAQLKEIDGKIQDTYYQHADFEHSHRTGPQPPGEITRDFGAMHGLQRDMTALTNQKIKLQDEIRKVDAALRGTSFKPENRLSPTIKQNVVTNPQSAKSQFQIGKEAFTQRPRGSLIDAYESARQISHTQEIESIIQEAVLSVFDNQELRLTRQQLSEVARQVAEDVYLSYQKDKASIAGLAAEHPAFLSPTTSAALKSMGITVREVSDLVRAGAIFLRPAYIPNNWASNFFLNTIHQGVYAPINLGKALVTDKHLGTKYTRAVDQLMGFNAAELVTAGRGKGYVSSAMDPVAHIMGQIADQPFRRAALYHELRRDGYKTMADIRRLMDKAQAETNKYGSGIPDNAVRAETTPALYALGKAARAAQEEIIKFGHMPNAMERNVLRNLVFVYSWMRGAGRYFGRFPFQHAIQAAAYAQLGNVGQQWLTEEMGGVPFYLIGAIPVGRDDKGNPLLINPFSVNPLGTGAEILGAAASTKQILTDPASFNRFAQEDPAELLNPVLRAGLEAYTGGRPPGETLKESIAPERLRRNLEHPGRGQVYPTTRPEAVGQFLFGSLFPRQANQEAITRSLERESADNPEKRIDTEVKELEERIGEPVPEEFINAYKADLEELKKQKDFKHDYARKHGSQGFDNLPAQNRAEAAVAYIKRYRLTSPDEMDDIEAALEGATTDAEFNAIANDLWRATGAGRVKDQWVELLHGSRDQQELTRKRP